MLERARQAGSLRPDLTDDDLHHLVCGTAFALRIGDEPTSRVDRLPAGAARGSLSALEIDDGMILRVPEPGAESAYASGVFSINEEMESLAEDHMPWKRPHIGRSSIRRRARAERLAGRATDGGEVGIGQRPTRILAGTRDLGGPAPGGTKGRRCVTVSVASDSRWPERPAGAA